MTTKILTFDCYGTLINTDPLYQWLENLAFSVGLDPKKVRTAYEHYEDGSVSVQPLSGLRNVTVARPTKTVSDLTAAKVWLR